MKWWHEARFGMFIHWGLYSGLAQGEWAMENQGIPADKYRELGRLGLYGDYFSFYMCDILFKVNGKGGQPVYIKVVSQETGRCAPK